MAGGGYMMSGGMDHNNTMFEDVFDKIDDLLDFSNEEMHFFMEPEPLTFEGADIINPSFAPVTNTTNSDDSSATAGLKGHEENFLCDDLDAAELEWLSNFVEESFSPTSVVLPKTSNISSNHSNNNEVEATRDANRINLHYRTPSPVSVLEHNGLVIGNSGGGSFSSSSSSSPTSSSSCSSVVSGVKVLAPCNPPEAIRAPRTKRSRPASLPRSHVRMPFSPDSTDDSLVMAPSMNSELDNFVESNSTAVELQNYQAPTANKKKKLKIISSASAGRGEENLQSAVTAPVRKCMHCEIQKTPQWRAGPMGPKTLCNACGVRYKSGRLFPEYRPAASPTFISTQHSNSHKKVIEMRVKASQKQPVVVAPLPASAKGCELLNYIRS